MSLLLQNVLAVHFRPTGTPDAHGWLSDDFDELGALPVSIQPQQEVGAPSGTTTAGYSAGPGKPGTALLAAIYAEPDADLRAGDRLSDGDEVWQVMTVVKVRGPLSNELDVLRATATAWRPEE